MSAFSPLSLPHDLQVTHSLWNRPAHDGDTTVSEDLEDVGGLM